MQSFKVFALFALLFSGSSALTLLDLQALLPGFSVTLVANLLLDPYCSGMSSSCSPNAVKDTGTATCDKCKKWSQGNSGTSGWPTAPIDVDINLYGNLINHHYNPYVHKYYNARLAFAHKLSCPATQTDIPLTTPWNAKYGTRAGQAWDAIGTESVVRNCTFPTATDPFICYGLPGTKNTYGTSLGVSQYWPIRTNDATPGNGIWTLFCQCWDSSYPGQANPPESFNVFSTTEPVLAGADITAMNGDLGLIGFDPSKSTTNSYPTLF